MRPRKVTPVLHHPCPTCYGDGSLRGTQVPLEIHTLQCARGHRWRATTEELVRHTHWLTGRTNKLGTIRGGDA